MVSTSAPNEELKNGANVSRLACHRDVVDFARNLRALEETFDVVFVVDRQKFHLLFLHSCFSLSFLGPVFEFLTFKVRSKTDTSKSESQRCFACFSDFMNSAKKDSRHDVGVKSFIYFIRSSCRL